MRFSFISSLGFHIGFSCRSVEIWLRHWRRPPVSISYTAPISFLEVGAIPVDNQPIYDKICRSVVKVVVYVRATSDLQKIMIPGIIAMSGDDYCYIIAFCSQEFGSLPSEVILPDGTKMKLQKQDLETRSNLVAFYVNTSARMKSVDFREDVSMNEEVFSIDFDHHLISTCNMSCGRVTYARRYKFSHDSPPSQLTPYGGLVFNKEAEFVGISTQDRGVTIALNVQDITRILALFHTDMMGKPLSEILQHIDDQAKSRKKRKRDDQAKSRKKRK